MKKTIRREVKIALTTRARQMMGMFDVAPARKSIASWQVEMELPGEWNIGVIVGPSGSGKSTIAAELFGKALVSGWKWPASQSILDGFPAAMGIKEITALLCSVGFSSPPAWLRPFRVLSNGQQFRVNLARTLAEKPELAVVDEFSSVVDRTVAKIGSAAVAAAVRRRGQKFVAVTCHYDVIDWLAPDWVYDVSTGELGCGELARGRLRRGSSKRQESKKQRPAIKLEIIRADRSAWKLFQGHHYLSHDLHPASKCFVGLVEGKAAAFTAVLPFPHASRPGWREHRTVCLPDFQGVGIGNAMSEYVASLFAASGRPYYSTTSHPAMIRHRHRSGKLWRMRRRPSMVKAVRSKTAGGMGAMTSHERLTAGFEFVGKARAEEARGFGLLFRSSASKA